MDSAKIMIVEDKAMVAEDCRDCLESLGYRVSTIVASGEEAVKKAQVERPDAVLMDIHLRDNMDGIDAAQQIYDRFEIPVVFLSAYSDRDLLERAKRVGSFGYLVKPFEERELMATLEIVLYKANAEKERRQMQAHLQQAQKMDTISTLAGGIAHQFNNALTAITGGLGILGEEFSDNKKIAHYVGIMRTAASRMTNLVAQLLAFARGGLMLPKTIPLNDFIRDTLNMYNPALNPAVRVEAKLSTETINVKADSDQMKMVLSAILTNAYESIEDEGCISIASNSELISEQEAEKFPGFKPGRFACLTVADNGAGMDEETRMRVFEPFFTTKFPGRGLGLSAAYGLIKKHDGYIWIDSEVGRGTKVKIYLPES